MYSEYYRRIKLRFIVTVTAVVLLLAGAFCWYGALERQRAFVWAEKQSASYVSALREHAERVFSEADSNLQDLVDKLGENGGISYSRTPAFFKYLRDRAAFSSLYVVDKQGDIIAHSLKYQMAPVNLAERDYFQYHLRNPSSGHFISKPFKSKVSNTWRFSLSRPLKDARGEFAGLVSMTFETDYFNRFYKTIDVGKKGRIILAKADGDVLVLEPAYDKPFTHDFKTSILFSTLLPRAPSGTHHVLSPISNERKIISYLALTHAPLVAIVSYDEAEITAVWLKSIYKQSAIGGLLIVLFVLLAFLFLRQVRTLEQVNSTLEEQQADLVLKAELLDAASDAIILLDMKGSFVYFNAALPAMSGYSREELLERGIFRIEPPEYSARIRDNIAYVLEHGEGVFESAYLCSSGDTLPIEVHARVAHVGSQSYVLSVVRDITERKEVERRLLASIDEWQDTFDAVSDVVWLLDLDRTIVRANGATRNVFGRSPQDVIGQTCCQVTYDETRPHDQCPFDQLRGESGHSAMQISFANRWYDVSIDPVRAGDGTMVSSVLIMKDITNLVRSEHREQFRAGILERIAGGEPLSQLLTYIAVSIEKENPRMLCSIMLVSDDGKRLKNGAAPSLPDFYNIAVQGTKIGEGIGSCGTAAFRKERVIVEDLEGHPFWKGFDAAREAGLRSCWSEPVIASTGELLGTFAIYHLTPAYPGEDEISIIQQASAFAGIAIERSKGEAERLELEHLFSQSQKMEAIGHLSGGIAHDFNNLLTPILIYSDMLKRSLPDNEKVHAQLDGILKASGKARDLTQQLLSFGRKQVMQMKVIDLNGVITAFHSMMRRTLRENICLSLHLAGQPVVIRADGAKLEQVLLNMVLNAQDAIETNGSISIETGHIMIDDEFARRHPGMNPGHFVLLSCTDNGCGMNPETLSRVFEPFFSTKEIGHGTGLGLANVYGIVKQHNGYIMAVSTPGSGTSFKIYLPVSDELPHGMAGENVHSVKDHRGSAVILLVEDNEMVRVMSTDLLEGFGYTVHAAEHPERALELLKEITGKVDLVITDVVMPGMNGQQLFERIRNEYPEIEKVLYISGYTNNVIVTGGALDEGLNFLHKPFTVEALMLKVEELLKPHGSFL